MGDGGTVGRLGAVALSLVLVFSAAAVAYRATVTPEDPGSDDVATDQGSFQSSAAASGPAASPILGDKPAQPQADEEPQRAGWTTVEELEIRYNEDLHQLVEDGLARGSGTIGDPIVIERLHVNDTLEIRDTSLALVIQHNDIDHKLKLNYNGPHILVRHNEIADLRVNENVRRLSMTTAGTIEDNDIAFVGQLRHWSGTFANNTVGPKPADSDDTYMGDDGQTMLKHGIAFNLDGYHKGKVVDNEIFGPVKVRLHGHFHGGCYDCAHHEHIKQHVHDDDGLHDHGLMVDLGDHTDRWHSLTFARNTISVQEDHKDWAVNLNDWGHDANDGTARSEQEDTLLDPHDHHLRLEVDGNTMDHRMVFGGLVSNDLLHRGQTIEVDVELTANDVTRQVPVDTDTWGVGAYEFWRPANLTLEAHDNAYTFEWPDGYDAESEEAAKTIGLRFGKASGHMHVTGTQGSISHYGVLAGNSPGFNVTAEDNDFNAIIEDVRVNG